MKKALGVAAWVAVVVAAALVQLLLLGGPGGAQTAKTKAALTSEVNLNFADNSTQAITAAILRATSLDMINSWQQYAVVNAQVGATYTVGVADYGKLVTFTNGSPVAVTLPQATGSFAIWNAYVKNLGAGTVTITPTTSTINGVASLALVTGQAVQVVSDGVNWQTWPATSVTVPSGNSGGIPCYNSAVSLLSSSLLTANAVMVGGGVGLCPGVVTPANGAALVTNNSGTPSLVASANPQQTLHGGTTPTWGLVTLSTDVTGSLPASAISGNLPAAQVSGTTTNDNATTGNIGEYLTATASGISLVNNTAKTIVTISLTAGDWDCRGGVDYLAAAGTVATGFASGWNTSTNTLPSADSEGYTASSVTYAASSQNVFPLGTARFSLATTTNVFMIGFAAFTVSTMSANGKSECRRAR